MDRGPRRTRWPAVWSVVWVVGCCGSKEPGCCCPLLDSFINPGSKFRVLDPVRAPVCSDSVAPHFGAPASEFMYRAGPSWRNLIRPHTLVWTLLIGGRVDCRHDSFLLWFWGLHYSLSCRGEHVSGARSSQVLWIEGACLGTVSTLPCEQYCASRFAVSYTRRWTGVWTSSRGRLKI